MNEQEKWTDWLPGWRCWIVLGILEIVFMLVETEDFWTRSMIGLGIGMVSYVLGEMWREAVEKKEDEK